MHELRLVLGMFSIGVSVLAGGAVSAQDYPNKPVRIVTSLPGGGNDLKARLIAPGISGPLGQPVIIDNRAALLSIEAVSKAPPDGYTLLIQGGTVWIFPLLAQTSFDAVRDFSPITLITGDASLVVVHPSLPVKSIKDLIALAKAKPGELNYASGPAATSSHLQTELFKSMAGVNILRVPYKSTGPALTGLIAGEVQVLIEGIAQLKPLVKVGKLRALAVTTAAPSAQLPDLPTVSASGVPGFEAIQLNGMWAPAKTPEPIIRRLNQEVVRVLSQPDIKEKLFNAGSEPGGGSPEELAAKIQADIKRWSKVIKEANIKVD